MGKHLAPTLGRRRMDAIDVDELDAYIATKQKAGLSNRTINRHLNLLHKLYVVAAKRRKVAADWNPVELIDGPKETRYRGRPLSTTDFQLVLRAFDELEDAESVRLMFLTVVLLGLRKGELLGLRWRDVALADPEGARLHVREAWVAGGWDTPKSENSVRTLTIPPALADELFLHRSRSTFSGDDERVFCSTTGNTFPYELYDKTLRKAFRRAGVEYVKRPFHDLRVTSLTQGWLASGSRSELMARAGHSDFKTTQIYINLAEETFPAEAAALEARLLGVRAQLSGATSPDEATPEG